MKLILLLFLVSCGDVSVAVGSAVGSADLGDTDFIPQEGEGRTPGQPLPPAFNERGCQFDAPGCGTPTPGTRLTPNTTPYPEQRR